MLTVGSTVLKYAISGIFCILPNKYLVTGTSLVFGAWEVSKLMALSNDVKYTPSMVFGERTERGNSWELVLVVVVEVLGPPGVAFVTTLLVEEYELLPPPPHPPPPHHPPPPPHPPLDACVQVLPSIVYHKLHPTTELSDPLALTFPSEQAKVWL